MSNGGIDAAIALWKGLPLKGRNEADVRECLVRPMLNFLGYSMGAINDIFTEESHGLSAPYLQVGSKTILIDYVPTLRLKRFWIIEVKNPSRRKYITIKDLHQAHFYAIHPEVQVPYVVITNGREIRLYDAMQMAKIEDAIVVARQSDCEETLASLYDKLHANSMLQFLRARVLSTLESALEVEVDENIVGQVQAEFGRLVGRALPKIRDNAQQVVRTALSTITTGEQAQVEQADLDTLMVLMDIPKNSRAIFGQEVARRAAGMSLAERGAMVDRLCMTWRGRTHTIFRVHCADALARLLVAQLDIPPSPYASSVKQALDELVTGNMTYRADEDLGNALMHLDNVTLRLAKKICVRLLMGPLVQAVKTWRETAAKEDVLRDLAGVGGHMVVQISLLAEQLWRLYRNLSDPNALWSAIWSLEKAEQLVDQVAEPSYPPGDGELTNFQFYGRPFDMLRLGTWCVLRLSKRGLDGIDAPESVRQVLRMERSQVLEAMPTPKCAPTDFAPRYDEPVRTLLRALKINPWLVT